MGETRVMPRQKIRAPVNAPPPPPTPAATDPLPRDQQYHTLDTRAPPASLKLRPDKFADLFDSPIFRGCAATAPKRPLRRARPPEQPTLQHRSQDTDPKEIAESATLLTAHARLQEIDESPITQ